jgi:glycosyltransferase involved in cell wall biosynthesis
MAPPPEVQENATPPAHGTVRSSGEGMVRANGEPAAKERGEDAVDVLIVSLGATSGLRAADEELLGSLRRAGAIAALVRPEPPLPVRTLMLTDLRWARASRQAIVAELRRTSTRAVLYSSTTAALLWPRPGAIRFDAPSAGNRPGRHGLWQRPLERRRLREAPLLLPWSEGALRELPDAACAERALILPVPIEASGLEAVGAPIERSTAEGLSSPVQAATPPIVRDIAAVAYVANPFKKGLDRILEAWRSVREPGEELVVAGASEGVLRKLGYALPSEGVRVLPTLPYEDYRALLRRARVFVCAARREDYGIAQLEALADGCMLVTTASPGPYAALPIARALDARLVGEGLAVALRTALDQPAPDYAERASRALAPFRRAEADRLVADQLLPRLLPDD